MCVCVCVCVCKLNVIKVSPSYYLFITVGFTIIYYIGEKSCDENSFNRYKYL